MIGITLSFYVLPFAVTLNQNLKNLLNPINIKIPWIPTLYTKNPLDFINPELLLKSIDIRIPLIPTLYTKNPLDSTNPRIPLNPSNMKFLLISTKDPKILLNPMNWLWTLHCLEPSKSLSILYEITKRTGFLLWKGYLKNLNLILTLYLTLNLTLNLNLSKELYKKLWTARAYLMP